MPWRWLNGSLWFIGLILAMTVCLSNTVIAFDHFQPVSAEELAMKSEPLAPGASAIILYHQVDRDDNGATSHEDHYVRIKILTEEGRKYADVEIPFLKDSKDVVNLKARTIRADGSIVNFDGKMFEKSLYKTRGVKYLAKTFTLPDGRWEASSSTTTRTITVNTIFTIRIGS